MKSLWAVALVALSCVAAAPVSAQSQTPTADQMETFQNLTPEQQQAILESMGNSGGGTTTRDGVKRDRSLENPETVRPRDVNGAETGTRDSTGTYTRDSKEYTNEQMELRPRKPRIRARDTILLDIQLKPLKLDAPARIKSEAERLEGMRERAARGNPYKLDANGILHLPGIAPISLAGLTEEQATARINSEPSLRDFKIGLTLLPLEKIEAEALKPFGYDLFAGVPSTYAPVTDAPVSRDYVVGPGDRIEVQLIGSTKGRHSLVVNRDGRIMFPELGPIVVSGLLFDQAKSRIESRVAEQMIGTQAVVSMGDLRSIRVFVLGEAEVPGSYTVSGLATVTNALFASGGVKTIGSLRNIQLKRGGRLVRRLDLYDLLLNGDTSGDVRLQPGDVIFIPPVGDTVAVTGEIRRPAIYELSGEGTVADLLHLSGGLTPEADPRLAKIERIDERRDRVVVDVDLSDPQARTTRLRSGDLLRIPGARPTYTGAVHLNGHVFRPGSFQFRQGMRLTDVLPSVDELRPNADLNYVLIRREQPGTKRVQALSADLEQALRSPRSDANPFLAPRDQVLVFDLENGRTQFLQPILTELKVQATSAERAQIVRVSGQVRVPGDYPLEIGMTVHDLVRAGGGLAQQAVAAEAELARYEVFDGQTRKTDVIKVDLGRALAGDPAADIVLTPFDTLVIKEISEWTQQEIVTLEGEVRFPGEYPIERGETMRSVLQRAGGLTPLAFAQGSVFTRESLKERERQQVKLLTDRMRQDLSTLALQGAQAGGNAANQAGETLAIGQSLLADLQKAEPVGRLVIDLNRVLAAAPNSEDDLILKTGDRLRIPKRSQEVTIIGEVQNATSHLYTAGLTRDDYLRMSGGVTKKADDKRIYVVRANGSVESGGESRWFKSDAGMQPGDTIVVPLDAERMRPLPLWTAVTTIIYNLAVAVAAIGSL
ncbi:MAG: SLBB domain-containing protein [Steroidobacteraceae bacterium]